MTWATYIRPSAKEVINRRGVFFAALVMIVGVMELQSTSTLVVTESHVNKPYVTHLPGVSVD